VLDSGGLRGSRPLRPPPNHPGQHSVSRPALTGLVRQSVRWESGLFILVVAIFLFGAIDAPGQFLTSGNLFNAGVSNGEFAIMALPMTLIIISGEIDLSVASILGMSSALLGVLWNDHWPMLGIFVVLLVAGAAAGLINGLLVTRAGLPSLAVTIGTLALYRGIAVILLGSNSISSFPSPYATIGVLPVPHLGNIPWSIAIFIVLAVIFGVVLHATPLGRSIFAMGNNAETALFSGIRVKRIKTGLFVVSGLICAVAGALWTFRLSTAVQGNGLGAELNVVAIVLLAGVSIFGGKGSIPGVVLAFVAFALLQNALLLTPFNQEAYGIVVGALLLISVFVPQFGVLVARIRSLKLKSLMSKPTTAH
jgi:rhamnose transport system permease protein